MNEKKFFRQKCVRDNRFLSRWNFSCEKKWSAFYADSGLYHSKRKLFNIVSHSSANFARIGHFAMRNYKIFCRCWLAIKSNVKIIFANKNPSGFLSFNQIKSGNENVNRRIESVWFLALFVWLKCRAIIAFSY